MAKGKSKGGESIPAQQEKSGRDGKTGRFLPGHSGNPAGRPRGIDLRALARARADAEGIDIDSAVWVVLKSMITRAGTHGDVQAAKLVLGWLCDADPAKLDVALSGEIATPKGLAPPESKDLRADIEKLYRLSQTQFGGKGDES